MKVLEKFYSDCEKARKKDDKRNNVIMFNSVSELNLSTILEKPPQNYNLFIKDTNHFNQCDICITDGMKLKLFGITPFSCDVVGKYKENNLLMVAFLNEHKLLNIPCDLRVQNLNQK